MLLQSDVDSSLVAGSVLLHALFHLAHILAHLPEQLARLRSCRKDFEVELLNRDRRPVASDVSKQLDTCEAVAEVFAVRRDGPDALLRLLALALREAIKEAESSRADLLAPRSPQLCEPNRFVVLAAQRVSLLTLRLDRFPQPRIALEPKLHRQDQTLNPIERVLGTERIVLCLAHLDAHSGVLRDQSGCRSRVAQLDQCVERGRPLLSVLGRRGLSKVRLESLGVLTQDRATEACCDEQGEEKESKLRDSGAVHGSTREESGRTF